MEIHNVVLLVIFVIGGTAFICEALRGSLFYSKTEQLERSRRDDIFRHFDIDYDLKSYEKQTLTLEQKWIGYPQNKRWTVKKYGDTKVIITIQEEVEE